MIKKRGYYYSVCGLDERAVAEWKERAYPKLKARAKRVAADILNDAFGEAHCRSQEVDLKAFFQHPKTVIFLPTCLISFT